MALTTITAPDEEKKKSALEKFATGLGIAQGVGNIAMMGSSLSKSINKPTGMQSYLSKKKSAFDIGSVG